MDGDSQYVTVRHDLFTPVAASPEAVVTTTTGARAVGGYTTEAGRMQQLITLSSKDKARFVSEDLGVLQDTGGLECPHCSKTFPTKQQLGRHLKVHVGSSKTFTCSHCDQTFGRRDHLRIHEKQQHPTTTSTSTTTTTGGGGVELRSSPSTYECDQAGCGRHFATYASYMKHRRAQHPGLDLDTSTAGDVQLQRADSTGSSNGRRYHGEKRFQCSQCSKRFPTSKDLKRHDVVHTGNREFQCSYCSHRFGRKDHRMRHEKKTHATEMSPLSPHSSNNNNNNNNNNNKSDSQEKQHIRWRHMSTPSVNLRDDVETDSNNSTSPPLRTRAMSTCEQRMDGPLYQETNFKYLAGGPPPLSPDQSVLMDCTDNTSMSVESGSLVDPSEASPPQHQLTTTSSSSSKAKEESSNNEEDKKAELDWIISDFMSDTPCDLPKEEEPYGMFPDAAALAAAAAAAAAAATAANKKQPSSQQQQPQPVVSPAEVYNSSSSETQSRCPKQLLGDFLTRTKNPVLPSIYIDNTLIVPEPSKQKYPPPLYENDFMEDLDFDTFLEDKEISETIFNM